MSSESRTAVESPGSLPKPWIRWKTFGSAEVGGKLLQQKHRCVYMYLGHWGKASPSLSILQQPIQHKQTKLRQPVLPFPSIISFDIVRLKIYILLSRFFRASTQMMISSPFALQVRSFRFVCEFNFVTRTNICKCHLKAHLPRRPKICQGKFAETRKYRTCRSKKIKKKKNPNKLRAK